MLKADEIETPLYACATLTLGVEHVVKLRIVLNQVLLRVIGLQR